jgi:hypothetical protein
MNTTIGDSQVISKKGLKLGANSTAIGGSEVIATKVSKP